MRPVILDLGGLILDAPAGVLRPGAAADVVVFDPDQVRDAATYDIPRQLAEGVPYVVINGSLVVDQHRTTGALPGRALTRYAQTAPNGSP